MANIPIRDRVKELRWVKAGTLIPHPKNYRRHPKAQQDALKGVLAELGIADALLVRETPEGLMLIDGHLRADILKDQEVPVLVLDLNEAEADKLLATLDSLAAMAAPDQDVLLSLLRDVSFESQAVNDMLEALANGETLPMPDRTGLTDPDDVPLVPEEPYVQYGDLWQLGDHRVLCGDSTKAEDVEHLMEGAKAVLMATDPPYGVDYGGLVRSRANQKKGGWGDIRNDSLSDDEMLSLLSASLGGCGATVAFVWHPAGARRFLFWQALESHGWRIAQEIVWVKNALVFGRSDYQWRHEPCLYAKRDGAAAQEDRTQTTVWEVNKPNDSQHPTQKPVELFAIPLRNHTKVADNVYDPFLGSGTTVMAAEKLHRICYGLDIEARYVQVTIERWQDYTGQKAVKL